MALTGLQIFKLLPGGKKEKEANCKKCGFPTCMAFAMKIAKGEADINICEFASDELKSTLNEVNKLQQKEIKFGPAYKQLICGNETVMFRHEKKFVNHTLISVELKTSDENYNEKLSKIINYSIERVGEEFKIDAVCLIDNSLDFAEKAIDLLNRNITLILVSSDKSKVEEILDKSLNNLPLVFLKDTNANELSEFNKKFNTPVVISANTVEELAEIVNKPDNCVLNLKKSSSIVEDLTYIRRASIEDKFEPLGFPVISFVSDYSLENDDIIDKTILASALIAKYSNIIVLDDFNEAQISTLIALRQNLYIDPQKPLQMEPKLYIIGDVTKDSPVIVTTNFALTYFTVAAEVEASGVGTYLILTKSDGMSVLTAWAANKFTGEIIAKAVKETEIESLINHKNIIIPGYVSSLRQEIEEELPNWNINIGTNEAVDIPDYLKKLKS
ncbi:MAG: acetyl-CoA decarbonylase/synthase complex subunit gamma [bacterium]